MSAQLAKGAPGGPVPRLDPVREIHVPPAWEGADAFVTEMPGWFRLDRTEGQERALYVAAEKDTLRQQLTGWLSAAGIPVLVVRGFGSQSYADVVHGRVTADPRDGVLLVVGVFDCSGEGRRLVGHQGPVPVATAPVPCAYEPVVSALRSSVSGSPSGRTSRRRTGREGDVHPGRGVFAMGVTEGLDAALVGEAEPGHHDHRGKSPVVGVG
ncbi:hypothetical protein [Streptomyces griseofuscus]|uniref:hypothetical protein n=1 Tax=Streptomyces griseofuscus TaxID=146922 RepID=UPI003808C4B0